VAAQPLRGGLDDEVGAEAERLAQVRGGERVVDDDGRAAMSATTMLGLEIVSR
jgi:hypothetical protein